MVEDVDDGIGDRADRPNAGEGELNRIPLSLSSAYGGKGLKMSNNSHAIHEREKSPTSWFLFAKLLTLSKAETVSLEEAEVVDAVAFLFPTPNFAV